MTIDGFDDTVVLRDVVGRPATSGGFTFVPALLWTADSWGVAASACPLEDYSTHYLPLGKQQDGHNELEYSNALWVRARLPIVFGFAPPTCSRPIRTTFLNAGFVGITEVARDRVTAVPFVCTDDEFEFRTELRFGMNTDECTRLCIAAAFWELLACEPDAIASYADWIWLSDGHGPNASIVGYWSGEFQVRGQVPDNLWA